MDAGERHDVRSASFDYVVRIMIPLGAAYLVQDLVLIEKDEEGKISSRSITPVRFVPLLRGTR